jgi:hypothetical protein
MKCCEHCPRLLTREALLKEKARTVDLLVPTSLFFYKTSYLNEEVNCTDPSLSVSIPCPNYFRSSSEEALARCEGLIYNIPLNGDPRCSNNHTMHEIQQTMISISYDVVETGFYYFIFANENEIVDNFVVANFNLQVAI